MITPSPEIAEGKGDTAEGSQPVLEPLEEYMETVALPAMQEPLPVLMFSPSRAYYHLRGSECCRGATNRAN